MVIPGIHFEVKRCERLEMPKWRRQAEQDAKKDNEPIVVYRQSRTRWRADVDAEFLLRTLRGRNEDPNESVPPSAEGVPGELRDVARPGGD